QIKRTLEKRLLKPHADHTSLLGCRMIGKSTILHDLVRHFPVAESNYVAAIYWDLGHNTPSDGEALKERRAMLMSEHLENQADVGSGLKSAFDREKPIYIVGGVLDELEKSQERLLLVIDGMDRGLLNGNFTRD